MADPTLAAIRTKVRRLTRSLSTSQLTDADIDEYVNTFVLYDFPEHLRLFNLRETFEFYTEPYTDVYDTTTAPVTSPLYNFKNKYITIHQPMFVAGYQTLFLESREQLYGIYPQLNAIASIGSIGNGVTAAFSGTLSSKPVLKNNVLFSSFNTLGVGLSLIDIPRPATPLIGDLVVPNDTVSYGTINYLTGAWSLTFPSAPAVGAPINSQTIPYQAARPLAVLFFDGKFTVRPVPDQPYKISMEVYVRPAELLSATPTVKNPAHLEEWWQYIAYGAAKKAFEDRMDLESIQQIMPEFKKQETLIQRRTIVQQTSQRTATVYTQENGSSGAYGAGWFSGGGTF